MEWNILAGKLPLGEFFINNSPEIKFQHFGLTAEFLCRAASFELRMTKIGPAILKLFNSTFSLS
jgi:hypothetical protein